MKKLVVCILFAALLFSAQAYALTVEIKPQIIDIESATSFEVFIKDVSDFGAFEFVLQYDPSLVTIDSVTGGTFLGSTGRPVWGLPPEIDNVHGKLTYADFTTGDASGASGSGSIATITFSLSDQIDTVLSFDANRSWITDTKGNVLPVTNWIGATITDCICTVTASAGSNGTISPSGEMTDLCNANKTFTITPDSCYNIADVVVDGVSAGAVSSYTLNCTGGNHTVAASFSPTPNYTVTVNSATGGTITPTGTVVSVPCGGSQKFEITPNRTSPDGCHRITDVLVDGASVGAVSSYEFKDVHSNYSIEANFKLNSCKLEISAGDGGNISPTGTPTVICGQHFVITPDSGYSVKDVTVNGVSVGALASYDFSCYDEGIHTISASFIGPDFWTIKASAGEHGSISASGDVKVSPGGSQTFTITPAECYQIADVKVDGDSVKANVQINAENGVGTYKFENVTQNHEIVASFVIKKHTVTVKAGENIIEKVELTCGESKTFTITPDECSKIADVKIGDTSVMEDVKVNDSGVGTYTLSNVKNDCAIDVSFSQNTEKTFTIEASVEGHGKIEPDGEGPVVCGSSRKFTFTPDDENAEIFEVRIDGAVNNGAKTKGEYVFENVTADHKIHVVFSPHIIKATAGEHGKIDPSGDVTAPHGESRTFTITPDASYKIADVRIDDRYSGMPSVKDENGVKTYTFENVTGDHKIHVLFYSYTIKVSTGEHGKIEPAAGYVYANPSGDVYVNDGEKQSFTITPDECYRIADVKVGGSSKTDSVAIDAEGVGTYTFEEVSQDDTVEVVFEPISKGDINADGVVDTDDFNLAMMIASGFDTSTYRISLCADVNGDNRIGIEDAVYIACASTVKGDIDGKGDIDIKDAVLVLKVMSGSNDEVSVCGDVNGDKKIGAEEVIYILDVITKQP